MRLPQDTPTLEHHRLAAVTTATQVLRLKSISPNLNLGFIRYPAFQVSPVWSNIIFEVVFGLFMRRRINNQST